MFRLTIVTLTLTLTLSGCRQASENEVVVYTALDQEFSEPHFAKFEQATGIHAIPKFDTEANKTVGLTSAIMAEANRPRCDVFWNNEILNTLRLQKQGLLQVYVPKNAAEYPPQFMSPDGYWSGFAARARILIVNTEKLKPEAYPTSVSDLLDETWKDDCGFAKPLFGTTATHAAVLFEAMGDENARSFFTKLKQNAKMYPGNKQVAQAVSSGEIAFGLTDTDDAMVEIKNGRPVAIVYPDQQADQPGTLFIPNTIAIIKDAPNAESAKKLVDYLLSQQVEAELAAGPSAQIPLNLNYDGPLQVESPKTVRAMEVDFDASVEKWDAAAEFLRELILQP